jgi:hypothetical protein
MLTHTQSCTCMHIAHVDIRESNGHAPSNVVWLNTSVGPPMSLRYVTVEICVAKCARIHVRVARYVCIYIYIYIYICIYIYIQNKYMYMPDANNICKYGLRVILRAHAREHGSAAQVSKHFVHFHAWSFLKTFVPTQKMNKKVTYK